MTRLAPIVLALLLCGGCESIPGSTDPEVIDAAEAAGREVQVYTDSLPFGGLIAALGAMGFAFWKKRSEAIRNRAQTETLVTSIEAGKQANPALATEMKAAADTIRAKMVESDPSLLKLVEDVRATVKPLTATVSPANDSGSAPAPSA